MTAREIFYPLLLMLSSGCFGLYFGIYFGAYEHTDEVKRHNHQWEMKNARNAARAFGFLFAFMVFLDWLLMTLHITG
jgi:hypothetical protein